MFDPKRSLASKSILMISLLMSGILVSGSVNAAAKYWTKVCYIIEPHLRNTGIPGQNTAYPGYLNSLSGNVSLTPGGASVGKFTDSTGSGAMPASPCPAAKLALAQDGVGSANTNFWSPEFGVIGKTQMLYYNFKANVTYTDNHPVGTVSCSAGIMSTVVAIDPPYNKDTVGARNFNPNVKMIIVRITPTTTGGKCTVENG